VPVKVSDAPLPIVIVALVLVPDVTSLKAELPPPPVDVIVGTPFDQEIETPDPATRRWKYARARISVPPELSNEPGVVIVHDHTG
jgi:hypothetical protein